MIAYEDLVTALNNWRARNGLSTTPVDYGDPVPMAGYADAQSAPDEVYDLSDDSGLIMTEDVARAQDVGAIETGVEIAQTADEAGFSEYDDPPGTGDYGDYGAAESSDDMYSEMASTESYSEAPADTVDADDDEPEAYSERGETLEAGADDVIDEQTAYDDVMSGADYDEAAPLDDFPEDEIDLDSEALASEADGDEPEPLPDPDDDEPRYE